jgi:quercetin dioxygenase-like cupin family protein
MSRKSGETLRQAQGRRWGTLFGLRRRSREGDFFVKTFFATLPEIEEQRAASGRAYREFMRVPTMSAGLYVLPAGAIDRQKPHREDEIYYVVRGRARFSAGSEDREVSPGSVIFVAAQVGHRFYDITEELAVMVFFAPAET